MNCCRRRLYVSTCALREYGLGTGSCKKARSARVIADSAAALSAGRRGRGGGSTGGGGGGGRGAGGGGAGRARRFFFGGSDSGAGGGAGRARRFFLGGASGGAGRARRFFFGGGGGGAGRARRFFFGGGGGGGAGRARRFFFGGVGGGAGRARRFFFATSRSASRSLRRRVTTPTRALACASLRPARRSVAASCSRRRSKRSTVVARAFAPGVESAAKARSALVIAARAAGVGLRRRGAFFGAKDAGVPARRVSAARERLLFRRAATADHIMQSVASRIEAPLARHLTSTRVENEDRRSASKNANPMIRPDHEQ